MLNIVNICCKLHHSEHVFVLMSVKILSDPGHDCPNGFWVFVLMHMHLAQNIATPTCEELLAISDSENRINKGNTGA